MSTAFWIQRSLSFACEETREAMQSFKEGCCFGGVTEKEGCFDTSCHHPSELVVPELDSLSLDAVAIYVSLHG